MNPKQLIVPAERGYNSEGNFMTVNGLPRLALRSIYIAKSVMAIADLELSALLQEEIDPTGFCGIELSVTMQRPSEPVQTLGLLFCTTQSFRNFRCFPRLLYPFLVGAILQFA